MYHNQVFKESNNSITRWIRDQLQVRSYQLFTQNKYGRFSTTLSYSYKQGNYHWNMIKCIYVANKLL